MARVLITYDTRYHSTQTIASWIAQGVAADGNIDVTVKNVADADPRDFDFVAVGSPIYEEHPLPSVVSFLDANRERLNEKDMALFVVCVDYGTFPAADLVHRYVADLQAHASGHVRLVDVFGGYLDVDKLLDEDRKLIEEFAKLIGTPVSKMNKLDEQSARNFGARIAHVVTKPL
jgi:menaquinone-dependent protoporphyrinogen IX oxidase